MTFIEFTNSFKMNDSNLFVSNICNISIKRLPYRHNGPTQCFYYQFSDDGLVYKYNDGSLGLDMMQKLKDIYYSLGFKEEIKQNNNNVIQLTLF